MRQHSLVWIGARGALGQRRTRTRMRPRARFTACACEACSPPATRRVPLSWARRVALVAAGLMVGQLLVIGIDAVIGGPGPFAWVSLLVGKGLS